MENDSINKIKKRPHFFTKISFGFIFVMLFVGYGLADPLSGLNTEGFKKNKQSEETLPPPNPFIEPVDDISLSEITLSAIVYGQSQRAALVNGNVVREGESFGSYSLMKIDPKRVLIKNDSGVYSVDLKGSAPLNNDAGLVASPNNKP